MAYFLLIFVLFSLLLMYWRWKSSRKYVDIISCFLLILFSSNSYFNGWDSYVYLGYFNYINSHGFSGFYDLLNVNIEPGYLILLLISSSITNEYQFLIFLQSILINVLLYFGVKRCGLNYTLFALLFFVTYYTRLELSTFRQAIAVSFFVYSLSYINNKPIRFIIINLIGALFHYSCVFTILFLPIVRSKYKSSFYWLLAVGALPAYFIIQYLNFSNIMSYFPYVGDFNYLLTKLTYYQDNDTKGGFSLIYITYVLGYLFVIYKYKYTFYKSNNIYLLNLFSVFIVLIFYLSFLPSLIVSRFEYYLGISVILCAVFIIDNFKSAISRFFVLYASVFIFCIVFRYNLDREVYFPYQGYLQYILFDQQPRSESFIKSLGDQY
ncbi:EpsG family protein [Photobacterium kishitanii]|uniref:EpsG family protein n=1 Tax=Photobacterium kishitanii TaxID=318456 RepID=A0A2T3KG55_9GAMM|nr:EpsG family protein [Photobacterium kishitanii]PSU97728.1 hypothetical protein C9J27_15375 [Photobacterium kishitanii]